MCGRWLAAMLVNPINRINYNLEMIQNLFLAKSKRVNEVPIPKDTVFCPKCVCTCCCGVESESEDGEKLKKKLDERRSNRTKKYEE